MKKLDDFDEDTLTRMRRCIACFAINMWKHLPDWYTRHLPHTALCSEASLIEEDEAERLT